MISGLGLFEVLIILLMVLMFFGSKELPRFIRESGRFIAKIRRYSEKVKQELDDATRISLPEAEDEDPYDNVEEKKKQIRKSSLDTRKALSNEDRDEKSGAIIEKLVAQEEFKKATTILFYAATKNEVQTKECIKQTLAMGKRVVLPYCIPNSTDMEIAEIKDFEMDVAAGTFNILEPQDELKGNFLKSDIQLAVCPGVAFDENGGRLGRGKGYYDFFLKELKDRAPLFGLAFQCQILDELLPFDYHDVPMDKIITETGILNTQTPI